MAAWIQSVNPTEFVIDPILFKINPVLFRNLPDNSRMNGVMSSYFSNKPYDYDTMSEKIGNVYIRLNHGANKTKEIVRDLLNEFGQEEKEYLLFLR